MELREEFRKYGAIESIELLKSGKPEAYVTFVDDVSAYRAVSAMDKAKFFVVPANTWHQSLKVNQPLGNHLGVDDEAMEEDLPPILKLNEECLLSMFKRFDVKSLVNLANVCKLFKNLLGRSVFPHIHTMPAFDDMTLAEARNILRCVGPYLETVTVDRYFLDGKYVRYLEKLNQYVGENIRELNLRFDQLPIIVPMVPILSIKTILPRLHKLSIIGNFGQSFSLNCAFLTHCLNLVEFSTNAIMTSNEPQISLSLPNLRYIFIGRRCHAAFFNSLIEQNPQLTCVKTESSNILPGTVKHLTNVVKLTIKVWNIVELINWIHPDCLQNLTKLTLMIGMITDLCQTIDLAKKLTKLQELKIYIGHKGDDEICCESYQAQVVGIAQSLPRLEKFLVQGVTLWQTTIFSFVRLATKLQSLHIHDCRIMALSGKFPIDGGHALVEDIMTARKWIDSEGIGRLSLFIDPDVYSGYVTTFEKNRQVCENVNVRCDCSHSRWCTIATIGQH